MKVKVIKRFNDRFTKERREVGNEYDYPENRAKELEKSGYVEVVKQNKKPEKQQP